eukprot:TRINITY_DN14748_c0_g2_i1.p1 TRINITY_DN14748_c0_g2~~TRINITY_DN14748_c0_g2_i1.p1  ORF type:complete len:289 (-),score=50.04 TRINITY_DN14748_c0_g2_i1:349-1215(-)
MAIHRLHKLSSERDFDSHKLCAKGENVQSKSLTMDLYTVDTCDILSPYIEEGSFSSFASYETASCADGYFAACDLDVDASQNYSTFASFAEVPSGILDASSALRSALLEVKRAAQLLSQQVQKFGVDKPSELQQFLADVKTLESRFVDTALPQLAQLAAEPVAKLQQPPSDVEAEARENMVQAQPTLPLPDPLGEVLEYVSEEHHSRTFAICDFGKLGVDSLGALRRHFSKFGRVDVVIEPRLTHETRFALMRMATSDAADTIVTAGEVHVIHNCELSVRRLDVIGSL